MLPVEVVVQEGLGPSAACAGERALLQAVEQGAKPAVLRGRTLGGELVLLGMGPLCTIAEAIATAR